MASRWGRLAVTGTVIALLALPRLRAPEALAGATAPALPPQAQIAPSPDLAPGAKTCTVVEQGAMVHLFDTRALAGGPYYVNDHTIVEGPDGKWHLFGIFNKEPMHDYLEVDFVHAVTDERDPARWTEGTFAPVAEPYRIALHAERELGEMHAWAPHVVRWNDRWMMVYQSGGADGDHASIRLAESDDLYRWTRVGHVPLFDDFCVARDPMLVRREGAWALYYTRCDSVTGRHSGVAYRLSHDLVHWSDAQMALSLQDEPTTFNSAYTESPFVFERGGSYFLSVSAYPLAWDATLVYRSSVPSSFPDAPYTRLRARAAEWVFGKRGELWITHAGPGQGGVWMSAIDGL